MILLSQRDLRWCDKKLGESSLTLGKFGCTTTCISMLSDYFKCFVAPDVIASNVHNYSKDGLINWTALKFDKFAFSWRSYDRNDLKLKDAMKDPSQAVLLLVNNGAHWVVGIKPTLLGNSYIVADPWTGALVDVIKVYKNITGAAYFKAC